MFDSKNGSETRRNLTDFLSDRKRGVIFLYVTKDKLKVFGIFFDRLFTDTLFHLFQNHKQNQCHRTIDYVGDGAHDH